MQGLAVEEPDEGQREGRSTILDSLFLFISSLVSDLSSS